MGISSPTPLKDSSGESSVGKVVEMGIKKCKGRWPSGMSLRMYNAFLKHV